MGLLDARGGPDRISGEEGAVKSGGAAGLRRAHRSLADFSFSQIVSRRTAYVSNPPGGEENRRLRVFEKFPNRPSIALSHLLHGNLTPHSRRSYQPENRFSSVSRPFLNISGAASRLRPGALLRTAPSSPSADSPNNNDRPAQARTTFGLCAAFPESAWRQSGM